MTEEKRDASGVKEAVLEAFRGGRERVGELPSAVGRVLEDAWAGLDGVVEEERAAHFARVLDAAADGVARGAEALKLAVGEARSRGQGFRRTELEGAAEDLLALEALFTERIGELIGEGRAVGGAAAKDLRQHAGRLAADLKQPLGEAVETLRREPLGLARDSARVAAGASRKAAGSLLSSLGAALDRLGGRVAGRDEKPD